MYLHSIVLNAISPLRSDLFCKVCNVAIAHLFCRKAFTRWPKNKANGIEMDLKYLKMDLKWKYFSELNIEINSYYSHQDNKI